MAHDERVEESRLAGFDPPDDPYHLLGYSLGGSYDQTTYTAEDLDLFWVGPGFAGGPPAYGLIDGSGTWRIPYGTEFRAVRPFRYGVAEVIVASKETSHTGPWTRIRPDGSVVRG